MATNKAASYSTSDFKNLFSTTRTTVLATTSIKAMKTGTATVTKAGYFPLCIAGFYVSAGSVRPSRMYISSRSVGSATVAYGVIPHWDTGTDASFSVDILWLKVV